MMHLYLICRCGLLCFLELVIGMRRIPQHGDARELGIYLFQQLDTFAGQLIHDESHPR